MNNFEDMKDNDLVNERVITLGNQFTDTKNKLKVTRTDPYGFWSIQYVMGGSVPKSLQGEFTEYSYAKQAIDSFVENYPRVRKITKIQDSVEDFKEIKE